MSGRSGSTWAVLQKQRKSLAFLLWEIPLDRFQPSVLPLILLLIPPLVLLEVRL